MIEIEHKYLVCGDAFRSQATHVYHIEQGYLSTTPTVRVRIRDHEAFVTIKGSTDLSGLAREEYEYSIPFSDAQALMSMCLGRTIVKDRYIVPHQGHTWEVDVFADRYQGLVLAEIEVSSIDEQYALPSWVGEEVTGQPQYYNAYMACH